MSISLKQVDDLISRLEAGIDLWEDNKVYAPRSLIKYKLGTSFKIYITEAGHTSGNSFLDQSEQDKWDQVGGAGGGGGVYITDVEPTSTGGVGSKVTSSDGYEIDSCSTDTANVRVHVLAFPTGEVYKPTIIVKSTTVTNLTLSADRPEWTGYADITIGGTETVSAVNDTGMTNEVEIDLGTPPSINTAFFSGYPLGQTEVKEDDTVLLQVQADRNIVGIEVQDIGACKVQSESFAATPNKAITVTIADRGTTPTAYAASIRVEDENGFKSAWTLTSAFGVFDGNYTLILNNTYPGITFHSINYPGTREALQNSDFATVSNSITNYDSVVYSSDTGELNIFSPTIYAFSKNFASLGGTYNVTTPNFKMTATRDANAAVTIDDIVVYIANVVPVISVTEPAARLRSGGNDSTSAQNHTITITSDQILKSAPTLVAPVGTWQGSWTSGDDIVWTRSLQIHDNDAQGVQSWGAISATGLGELVTSTITGNSTYEIGGFVSRDIYFSAFSNETTMGINVVTAAKLVGVDKDLVSMTYAGNDLSDIVRNFTITQPTITWNATGNILYWNDVTAVNNNTTGGAFIRIEETV